MVEQRRWINHELTDEQKIAWIKLSAHTWEKCRHCENAIKGRHCCSKIFCKYVKLDLDFQDLGHLYEYKMDKELPFMGQHGCIVSATHRQPCAAFVCPHHMRDAKFREKYLELARIAYGDPNPPIPGGTYESKDKRHNARTSDRMRADTHPWNT